jgi:phage terminase large subunit-like protein
MALRASHLRRRPPDGKWATKGREVIAWIEQVCVYPDGPKRGEFVKLLVWQKLFILALFCVDDEGFRIYRWALLGIPKKNGKTTLAAWLGLYFLIGDDEPTPLVICAAASDDQADLVFEAATNTVKLSPFLTELCETYSREILCPSNGGKFKRVSAAAGTNDGKNISVVIIDEFHEWVGPKGRAVWTVLTNGIGNRLNPLVLQITTAGILDEDSLWYQHYQLGQRLVEDPEIDPGYLFWWYEAEETADYRDPAVWEEVNPSWGETLPRPEAFFRDQLTKKTESEFKRYYLNRAVYSEEIWLADGTWDACINATELDADLPLYVGMDGALKRDSFAVVAYQPQPLTVEDEKQLRFETGVSEETRLTRDVVRSWLWENPYPRAHPLHDTWKLDLDKPFNVVRELRDEFRVAAMMDEDEWPIPGPAFGYDPYLLEYAAQQLEGDGLNMVEVPQTDARMCAASELLYQKIMTKQLEHLDDPALKRHIHGAVPKEKERGWRLARPRGSRRTIDGAIGLAIATLLAHQAQPDEDEPGIY